MVTGDKIDWHRNKRFDSTDVAVKIYDIRIDIENQMLCPNMTTEQNGKEKNV